MRLQEKQEIDRSKASDRKREVDEGMKLAHKVDTLRETSQKEEANLKKFRDAALKAIQSEIDVEIVRRDALKRQNTALEQERVRLQAPIDLTEEWEKVNKDKLDIETWKRDLFDREASVISREVVLQELPQREKVVKEKEKQAEVYLQETNKSYDQVETIRLEMVESKKTSNEAIQARYTLLKEKEIDLEAREFKFGKEQERLQRESKEVLDRGTGLIARESAIEAKEKELFEREEIVKENENLTKRYLKEANDNYDKSEKVRVTKEQEKEESDKDIREQYRVLSEKQKELGYRERDLNLERESLEKDKLAIANEKLHIASQQETLKGAWENIRKLKK